MLKWLDQEKDRGILFRSDGNMVPFAECDASNRQDPKDGLVMYGYRVVMANAPVVSQSCKLKNIAFSAPASEFMGMANAIDKGNVDAKLDSINLSQISSEQHDDARGMSTRWTGASIMWLRGILNEIGMNHLIDKPTVLFSDSSGAIDWIKYRKITPGNNYILLAYHQVGELKRNGAILPMWKRGKFNCADLMTKPSTAQDIQRLLRKFLGYDLTIPEEEENGQEP